jgi:hypothetical protein
MCSTNGRQDKIKMDLRNCKWTVVGSE